MSDKDNKQVCSRCFVSRDKLCFMINDKCVKSCSGCREKDKRYRAKHKQEISNKKKVLYEKRKEAYKNTL
tara:strand:+ start:2870 stop:3079 length:210 start_codon:yes stop_codon:yes gene_type:complete